MPSVALEDVAVKEPALPVTARARTRRKGRLPLSWGQTPRALLVGAISIAGWIGLWELASVREWQLLFFRFENIPAPSEVLRAGVDLVSDPKLGSHVWNSLVRIFTGFGVAAVLAVGVGLGIGRLRLARESLLPPLEVLRPVPAVAWIPLSILLFSSAEESMIFITFIGAFFPILLNTIHGVEAIDSRLINASLTLGAGPVAVFREVILPGALPSIITGLSIGMGTSWFSLVSAEMISGQFGIGYYTWEAYTLQNYSNIVLGMVGIGVLGMGSSVLIKRIGRRCMPWFNPEANAR